MPFHLSHAGGPHPPPSTTQPIHSTPFQPTAPLAGDHTTPTPAPAVSSPSFTKIRSDQPHTDVSMSILEPDCSPRKPTAKAGAAMAGKLDRVDNLQAYLMHIGVSRRRLRQAGGGSSLVSSLEPPGSCNAREAAVSGDKVGLEDRESRMLVEEKDDSRLRDENIEGRLDWESTKGTIVEERNVLLVDEVMHGDHEIDDEPTLAIMLKKTKNLKRRKTDDGYEQPHEINEEPTLAVMLKKTNNLKPRKTDEGYEQSHEIDEEPTLALMFLKKRKIDRGKEQPQESTLADMLSRTIETKLKRFKASVKSGKAKFKSMSSIIHNLDGVDIKDNRTLMETKRLIKQARKSRTDKLVKEKRMNSLLDVIAGLDHSNATSSISTNACENDANPIVLDR